MLTIGRRTQTIPISCVISALLFGLASTSSVAATLISNHTYLDYELPANIQDKCAAVNNCPDIKIKYIHTNQDWLNHLINARINTIVINSHMDESKPSDSSDRASAISALDDFAKSTFIDSAAGRSLPYQLSVTPRYIGHLSRGDQNLELFEISAYVFTGGAHGLPTSEYLIVDPAAKTQVTLDDMLINGQKSQFAALAYEAYQSWVATFEKDVARYEKNWPFYVDDNVTLTDKGIDIRYPHYAIGPYAYGMPVLSVPYDKLRGVIQSKYLFASPSK